MNTVLYFERSAVLRPSSLPATDPTSPLLAQRFSPPLTQRDPADALRRRQLRLERGELRLDHGHLLLERAVLRVERGKYDIRVGCQSAAGLQRAVSRDR